MDAVAVPDGYVSGSFEAATSLGSLTRRVIRRDAPGPTVILIHKSRGSRPRPSPSPTSSSPTATGSCCRSCSTPRRPEGGTHHQVAAWSSVRHRGALGAVGGSAGAIVEWLRASPTRRLGSTGDRPVGVVGMCFSGGSRSARHDPAGVRTTVIGRPAPAVPAPVPRLGPGRLEGRPSGHPERVGAGRLRPAMRFSRDRISPREAIRADGDELPGRRTPGDRDRQRRMHSVLARAVEAARRPAASRGPRGHAGVPRSPLERPAVVVAPNPA